MGRSLQVPKGLRFDPEIPYADDSPLSRMQKVLYVRDYGAIGDGTYRTVAEWLPGGSMPRFANLTALQAKYTDVTSPTDSLDWAAIQKAVKSGRNVVFHDGIYMLGNNRVTSSILGQSFSALNSSAAPTYGSSPIGGAIIKWEPTVTSQSAWLVTAAAQRFYGLKFSGASAPTDNVAVICQKATNTDDLDVSFISCQFYDVYQSIIAYGRGVLVFDCQFSSVKSGISVTSDWPTSGTTGGAGEIDDRYKGRDLRIVRNRHHGSGNLLWIKNYIARGAQISLNQIDFGNQFLQVDTGFATGGLLYADLTGNIVDLCGRTIIQWGVGTSCVGMNINGGSYGGSLEDTIDGADHRPTNFMLFTGPAEVDGVTLNGVNIHNTDSNMIQFSNAPTPVPITVKNLSINGGQITGIGQTGTARVLITSVFDMENLTLNPSSISSPGPSSTALIRATGKTITGLSLGSACALSSLQTVTNDTAIAGVVTGMARLPNGLVIQYQGSLNNYAIFGATTNKKFNVPQRNWLTSNNWISSTSAADNSWNSACWSPERGLFVAVASSGTGNRVQTSPDGINWTAQTSAADNSWNSVCWAAEANNGQGLFVAVASTGTMNRVMTSPNGTAWTIQTTPQSGGADLNLNSVCWSPERGLFVAVAFGGGTTTTRAMTSPDGITWTVQTTVTNTWRSVCWSPERRLFVAVANAGTGNRVMTSIDGVTWVAQASAADNDWRSVCWAAQLGLFVAVGSTGTGNRVMTSPDGTAWTLRTSAADNDWYSVRWAPEIGLLAAVASTGTGTRVMTSDNGTTWTTRTSAADNDWRGLCWSPEQGLFASVAITGTGNRVMTSKSAYSLTYR